MRIALLGSIPKGDETRRDWIDWKVAYKKSIRRMVPQAEFLDGDAISDNAGPQMVVGHDLSMIKHADICIVDAQGKIGAGTAQEIVIAKYLKKPVVTVIPKNSHHRRTNITFHGVTVDDWIHPFLFVSSDHVAESVDDAATWIAEYINLNLGVIPVKDISVFEDAIEYYENQEHNHTVRD